MKKGRKRGGKKGDRAIVACFLKGRLRDKTSGKSKIKGGKKK